jgi:hypothetical protein
MNIETFKVAHLDALTLQPSQQYLRPLVMREELFSEYEKDGYSALVDGRVVACGGFLTMWKNRAQVWAILAADIGPDAMKEVHFAVKRGLAIRTESRIEGVCDTNFINGHRWLRALGFTREGTMKKYTAEGRDCDLYARVK